MSFASKYLSEIESGKGLIGGAKGAASGSMKDIGKRFGKENIVRSMFGGDDILSTIIRTKLGVKGKTGKTGKAEQVGGAELSGDTNVMLKVIAKNSMALPGMARDMNVLRQNIQKLVKIKGGKKATGADEFFDREKKREEDLEAERLKGGKSSPTVEKKEDEGGGSTLLAKLIEGFFIYLFAKKLIGVLKDTFSKKNLLFALKRVFLPLAIIGTLFSGITAGFKKYQETGSFSEALVTGLGGALSFLTAGFLGEDTLRTMFDSIANFFSPITDTISKIFTGIKNFFKELFGIKVEDEAPKEMDKVRPNMPDMSKFASGMAKSAGESDEKSADIGGLFGAVQSGDAKGLLGKAQEFAAKYPEPPATETTPTPVTAEGIPLDQAQRNYELNKALTGEASKALGQPLEMPAAPTAAPATPPAPVQTAPTPAPEMSDADKIKQLEGYIAGNKKRFARREADAKRHIASFSKRQSPEETADLQKQYDETLAIEKKEMEDANAGFQRQIDFIKNSKGGTVSAAAAASPSVSSGGGSESAASVSAGGSGGGGGGGALSAGSSAPSGADVSQASSDVAEGQRMESAADTGSVVNAPTTNNSSSAQDGAKPPVADAYNEDFARLIRT